MTLPAFTPMEAPKVLHRWPRCPASVTLFARKQIDSSPASQHISSLDVVSTRVTVPVSRSVEVVKALRTELCKGVGSARAADVGVCEVFMHQIIFFRPLAVIPNGSQKLGSGGNGPFTGEPHGRF